MNPNETALFKLWQEHRLHQPIDRIFHRHQPGKGWRGWYAMRGDEREFLGESYSDAAQAIVEGDERLTVYGRAIYRTLMQRQVPPDIITEALENGNAAVVGGAEQGDDWALTVEQAFWMLQHHNVIMDCQNAADGDSAPAQALDALINADEFKALFGAMGFDEALDRYETMTEAPDPRDARIAALEAALKLLTDALRQIAEMDRAAKYGLSEYVSPSRAYYECRALAQQALAASEPGAGDGEG